MGEATYRIVVLGAGGFVGRQLCAAASRRFGSRAEVFAYSRFPDERLQVAELDVLDADAVRGVLLERKPTHVINLAGIAQPRDVARDPEYGWRLHAIAPDRIGRQILDVSPATWLLHVGTGLVYGRTSLSGEAMSEDSLLAPVDAYGVTKAAGDLALGALAEEGLRCLRLRPFNHTGPGQSEDFVVPAFAAQIARIGRGERPPVLRVGNLEAKRDFLDVRDVVSAYLTMVEQTSAFEPGMALNVSSGTAIRIGDILESLVRLAGVDVSIEVDPEKWRPVDIPVSYGDSGRLSALTGWRPLFAFNDTLIAVLNRQVTGIEQF